MANRITRDYCLCFEAAVRKPEDQQRFWDDLSEDLKKGTVSPADFSVRQLFETFVRDSHGQACGREILEQYLPDGGLTLSDLAESGSGAVTTGAFSKIMGQIVYNEILNAWNNPDFIADQLVRTVPTSFLDGEKIAGISAVGDDAEAVGETQPYPLTGITQAYVETPAPVKRGHILTLSREVLIGDRTGVVLDRARTISQTMRMNKEKRVLDCVMGVTTSWKRNGSAATATYAASSAGVHNFDNVSGTTSLVDYTDVEAALLLLAAMTDPETGEPIMLSTRQILVPQTLLFTARRVVNATQLRYMSARDSSSAASYESISANPLVNPNLPGVSADLQILSSPYVDARISSSATVGTTVAANTWYLGDFRKAFRYMEVWPLSVQEMPQSADLAWRNDIVRGWKVSEFGVPAVIEPRYVVQCTVA
jgi:hypothetical protein